MGCIQSTQIKRPREKVGVQLTPQLTQITLMLPPEKQNQGSHMAQGLRGERNALPPSS